MVSRACGVLKFVHLSNIQGSFFCLELCKQACVMPSDNCMADVMARGMDIPECDAVVNLELPSDASHYAHRAGRTGRLGR